MSEHRATIEWERGHGEFRYSSYPRDHTWTFEGGVQVSASAAPGYLGNPDFVDPEEAYVASLASCHMLTFLAIAVRKGLVVDRYRDAATGFMGRNADGKMTVARVVLRPEVSLGSPAPSPEAFEKLHEIAHEECFIANSVRTAVTVEGRMVSLGEQEYGRMRGPLSGRSEPRVAVRPSRDDGAGWCRAGLWDARRGKTEIGRARNTRGRSQTLQAERAKLPARRTATAGAG